MHQSSSPRRRGAPARRPLAAMLALVGLLLALPAAAADQAPAGRWRCYQPPAYTVLAWFDLDTDGSYRVNGGAIERAGLAAGKPIRWAGEGLVGNRFGIYLGPGVAGGDAARHTIVLVARDDARPGQPRWDKLPRCYLTTH